MIVLGRLAAAPLLVLVAMLLIVAWVVRPIFNWRKYAGLD